MKLYLASSYSRRLELAGYAAELVALGHEVVSTWIDGHHETRPGIDTNGTDAERRGWASEDLRDLTRAEGVILFTDGTPGRGGKDFEAGFAYAKGAGLYLVGPRTNVFCTLADIQVDSWPLMRALLLADEVTE